MDTFFTLTARTQIQKYLKNSGKGDYLTSGKGFLDHSEGIPVTDRAMISILVQMAEGRALEPHNIADIALELIPEE